MPSSGIKICHIVNQQLFCISVGEKQKQKQKTKNLGYYLKERFLSYIFRQCL